MKHFLILVFLFVTSLVLSQNAVVLAVHDGDSYKVRFDSTNEIVWVRLYGIDCPEVVSNHITNSQPYGRETGDFVRNLIKGKPVQVDSLGEDVYGRMVAKVTFNGTDLTQFLLTYGYGWYLQNSKLSSEEISKLKSLQEFAKNTKQGLWALPGRKLRPSTWRSRHWRYGI